MAGRKVKEFSQETFEKLAKMQCTQEEICFFLNTTDKTLSKWCKRTYGLNFSEAIKKYSADGKISLRRYQFELAKKNASMAIWLGKQYLGQKDEVQVESKTVHPMIEAIAEAMKK